MKKNNIKFEDILLLLWWVGLIWIIYIYITRLTKSNNKESFTPTIRSLYRPHLRNFRIHYENFTNEYSTNYFVKILKRVGIY